jgi:hypothetical protein
VINVGSVAVEIVPDASQFAERLRAELRNLPAITIDVDADTTAARAAIDQLARNRDAKVDIDVDSAVASAKLDELSRDRTVDLTVREHHVSYGDNIGPLGVAGILGAPLLAPFGAAALGGLAGIATAGVAGVAGLGTLALGLSGVKNAVDAVTKAQQGAGVAGAQAGIAQVNAAAAVKAAQMGLSNAVASAAYQQVVAEQNLQQAQIAATQAQQQLNAARLQAKQQIEDLTLAVQDGALAQRQADLSVREARENLVKVLANPQSTELQREQAQLTYDQAVQQVTDLGVRQQRLQAQQQQAVRDGVNGSSQVVSAQQSVARAVEAVRLAQLAQANTARQGTAAVAGALLALQNAQRGQATASQAASAASKAAAIDLAALTPQARAFAAFVIGTMEPAFARLKSEASSGLLPGIQAGFQGLLPVLPELDRLVHQAALAMGDLFDAFGLLMSSPFFTQFFDDLSVHIGPAIKDLGQTLLNLGTAAAGLFQAFLPITMAMGDAVVRLTQRFADFSTHLQTNVGFQSFLTYIKDEGPVVMRVLGGLIEIIGKLVVALAPLGAMLLGVVDAVVQFLAPLSPSTLLAIGAAAATMFLAFKVGLIALRVQALETASAMAVLDVAMNANPIGAVLLAATGLVGMFALLTSNSDHLAPHIDLVTAAEKRLTDATTLLNSELQKSIDAFTVLNGGALSQERANETLAASMAAVAASARQNGASLDIQTAAGRANRAALVDVVTAINDKITADFKVNETTLGYNRALQIASAQLSTNRARLVDVATQSGLSRTAAQKLIDTILLTPKQVVTNFKTPDLQIAQANVDLLRKGLEALRSGKWLVNLAFVTKSLVPGVVDTTQTNLTTLLTGGLPARAFGGPVLAGHDYWVGENGPEMFHATQSGYISSHTSSVAASLSQQYQAGASASGGAGLTINGGVNVYEAGAAPAQSIPRALRNAMFLAGAS